MVDARNHIRSCSKLDDGEHRLVEFISEGELSESDDESRGDVDVDAALASCTSAKSWAPRKVTQRAGPFDVVWSIAAAGGRGETPVPEFLCMAAPERFGTMTAARRFIRRRQIRVNFTVACCATSVKEGDVVDLIVYPQPNCAWSVDEDARRQEVAKLLSRADVLYEDDDLLAVAKPAGVLAHPPQEAHDIGEATMLDIGLARGALGLVHRLDRGTSGVLLFAKSTDAFRGLQATWADRSRTSKEYVALIQGTPGHERWEVDCALEKPCMAGDKGRKRRSERREAQEEIRCESSPWAARAARTSFRLASGKVANGFCSLVLCQLEDGGRTHQIRRHLHMSGHPVVGDDRYGAGGPANKFMKKRFKSTRLFLHAHRLRVQHPSTRSELVLHAPLPEDFSVVVEKLDGGSEALSAFQRHSSSE